MEKGLIHIYHGNGKGKTTAGMGLCIRAYQQGFNVAICQFLKGENTGERDFFKENTDVYMLRCPKKIPFVFKMTEEEKSQISDYYNELFNEIISKSEKYDLIFLDEILDAVGCEIISEEKLINFLKNKPEGLEVVITGRNPSESLIELADYVTEMKCIKHPYEKNIIARKGIEY